MDKKTKQAWTYVRTLNEYSKEWDQPLGELIHKLIDNMAESSIEDRQDFIEGLIVLHKKKKIIGDIKFEKNNGEIDESNSGYTITLQDVKLNPYTKIWYWIPFKIKNIQNDLDMNEITSDVKKWDMNEITSNVKKIENNAHLQFLVNTIIPILTFIIVVLEFFEKLSN
ncbi:MAG: hypothetical protein J6K48_03260 [Lachnospiraceae bacterium]|nr:hypothetical protein [Lachnospiraceae bacterium]